MAKVLVFAEQRDGKLKKASMEIVAAASKAGHETHVALLGSGVDGLAKEIGGYGASKVHLVQSDALKNYTGEAYAKGLQAVIQAVSPDWICASHSPMGRDLLPRLAARLGAGLASDCTQVNFAGNVSVRRPVFAGKATAEVEFSGPGPKLLTIRPNALGLPPADASKTAQSAAVSADLGGLKSKFVEFSKGTSTRPDVTEASIVVSGGRALKSAENFKILEELADTVGAAVGASRAAVDAGFRPHRDQVGQTGKVVSPSLYLAFGISGAIQHLAGMRTSKVIVAVNTDAEAPIFQVADYGIVGDLFTFVPLLKEEFKKIKDN
jgi:electron transfer flavoprotein alpha subunit